jgi:gamma-glutamyl-gamma-aminobutyrate hydrolase PuuD
MSEPRFIAVSQRVVEEPGRREVRDALDQRWAAWLDSLGLQCVPVPNRSSGTAAFLEALRPSGVILSGGNNLALDVYEGALPAGGGIEDAFESRDGTENALVGHAIENRLPLLACCRGMQFLQAHFGGKLALLKDGPLKHAGTEHEVRLVDAEFLELAGSDSLKVNSYHDYGIRATMLAEALAPFAISPLDSVVEGCRHRDLPIVGIMWHPERPNAAASFDSKLAARLFGGGFSRGIR